MNPGWFLVGLALGERLRNPVLGLVGRLREKYQMQANYEGWLATIPVTHERND